MGEYIYIRRNEFYYDQFNICKLGRTRNIPERDGVYATGEYKRGYFELVIELFGVKSNTIEKILQNTFKNFHMVYNGGQEFYSLDIIEKIIPFLDKLNLKYKVLNKLEISNLTRETRIKDNFNKINKDDLISNLYKLSLIKEDLSKEVIIPNKVQNEVLLRINDFYKENNKGKILWACGLGKALLSILIVKECGFKKVIIGVPSLFLQNQMVKEVLKIFPLINNILIVNGNSVNNKRQ